MRGTGVAQKLIDTVRQFLAPKPVCRVCGRPLYNKDSIARGMGPTCAGHKARKDTFTIDMFGGNCDGNKGT